MVDVAPTGVVAILTRAPSAGGKSRLFRELGRPFDPDLMAALLLDTLDAVRAADCPCRIAVEPATACEEVRALAPGVEVVPQSTGSLGERMSSAIEGLLTAGAGAAAIVGSDLPDLQPSVIGDAFSALEREPQSVAIGPARDGGYYLIGATAVPPLFDGIAWGSASVLDDTRALARARAIPLHILPAMDDVDDVAALRRVVAPRTRAWAAARL